jgi:hypothetical protein
MFREKAATLDQAGEATGWIGPNHGTPSPTLDLSIEMDSAFVGTVVLQKIKEEDDVANPKNVKEYTESAEEQIEDNVPGTMYRLYCSERSAGSAAVSLYK